MRNLIETIKLYTAAAIEKNKEDEKQKQLLHDIKRDMETQKTQEQAALDAKNFNLNLDKEQLAISQRLADLDVQKLQAAGAPDTVILEKQIQLLRERQELLLANPLLAQPGEIEELGKKIDIGVIQLERLRNSSIDIAGFIGRTVEDITSAVVSGTLHWADIGRSALASLARSAFEDLTGILRVLQSSAQPVSADNQEAADC
jgi:hypothetical protein